MNRLAELSALLACALLAGCVTYSYPQPYDLGSRHTSHDAAYARDYSGNYNYSIGLSSAYYPWWSVDYFYLGFHYYRPAGYWGHGYFAPYYPYYYRPWYYPSYAWGWSYWQPYAGYGWGSFDPYWHYRYRQHVYDPTRHHHPLPGRPDYRPPAAGSAGDPVAGPGRRPAIGDRVPDRDRMRRSRSGQADHSITPDQRTVTVAPRSRADDRGMVVIGGANNKIRPSRTEPVSSPGQAQRLPPARAGQPLPAAPPVAAAPAYRPPLSAPPVRQAAPARQASPARNEGRSMRGSDRREPSSDSRPARRTDDSDPPRAARFRDRDRD
jgi:hypothetical protein